VKASNSNKQQQQQQAGRQAGRQAGSVSVVEVE